MRQRHQMICTNYPVLYVLHQCNGQPWRELTLTVSHKHTDDFSFNIHFNHQTIKPKSVLFRILPHPKTSRVLRNPRILVRDMKLWENNIWTLIFDALMKDKSCVSDESGQEIFLQLVWNSHKQTQGCNI